MLNEREVREMERKDRIAAVKHNRKIRSMELAAQRKKSGDAFLWVWEFSKKLVQICSVLFFFGFIYACVVMWKFFDFTYLGTLMDDLTDIMKTCVFGYFIKAGLENTFKIWMSKRSGTSEQTEQVEQNEQTEQDAVAELTPPDGDE
jgi:hypothetical protein